MIRKGGNSTKQSTWPYCTRTIVTKTAWKRGPSAEGAEAFCHEGMYITFFFEFVISKALISGKVSQQVNTEGNNNHDNKFLETW